MDTATNRIPSESSTMSAQRVDARNIRPTRQVHLYGKALIAILRYFLTTRAPAVEPELKMPGFPD
jgi:hypothetical protein